MRPGAQGCIGTPVHQTPGQIPARTIPSEAHGLRLSGRPHSFPKIKDKLPSAIRLIFPGTPVKQARRVAPDQRLRHIKFCFCKNLLHHGSALPSAVIHLGAFLARRTRYIDNLHIKNFAEFSSFCDEMFAFVTSLVSIHVKAGVAPKHKSPKSLCTKSVRGACFSMLYA
jgi:hypothetical protein